MSGEHANFRQMIQRVQHGLESGERSVSLRGMDSLSTSYVWSELSLSSHRNAVLVVPDEDLVDLWGADFEFFNRGQREVVTLKNDGSSAVGHLGLERKPTMRLMATLNRLIWSETPILLVTTAPLFHRYLMPRAIFDEMTLTLSPGDEINRETLAQELVDLGYISVPVVEDMGTFALRGSVVDIFPPHLPTPVRLELWGDEIEEMSAFAVDNQRRLEGKVDAIILSPIREFYFTGSAKKRARSALLSLGGEAGIPTRRLQPMLEDLAAGIPFVGIQGVAPFFHERLESWTAYLGESPLFWFADYTSCELAWTADAERYKARFEDGLESGMLVAPPERWMVEPSARLARPHGGSIVQSYGLIFGEHEREESIEFRWTEPSTVLAGVRDARQEREPLRPLVDYLRTAQKNRQTVGLVCIQKLQRERLIRLFRNCGLPTCEVSEWSQTTVEKNWTVNIIEDEISRSIVLPGQQSVLISGFDIFGPKVTRRRRRAGDEESPFVKDFRDLSEGDFVVHADHGIGLYEGLKKLSVAGVEADFLVVSFAGADKLYLPIYRLGRLQKYSGGGQPRVTKLGGAGWEKIKAQARIAAEEDALALLELYAKRELSEGFAFSGRDEYFRAFEDRFPFEETEDQARSIEEVLDDMQRIRPMDRLLCGDVGFGKTEVAIRAAFKAVLDGKQVCLLVPTTVLALQHYKTFRERFSQYPIRVGLFTRLVKGKALKAQLDELKLGTLDIAIGTHRLVGKDVIFADLGLLLLDEEHRFGVKHKDRIKALRAQVDVLAMTATPIPRTLQMSLGGIRDLSVIRTPPAERLSVKTFVCRTTDILVRDAIQRELARGGQVFFVHNRVHSIDARAGWLSTLVPEARIAVGHGQMTAEKLEQVMIDFTNGHYNILVATTIIESGIDIPSANTMFIDDADQFGLAQLYQLRGRVGRGSERGFCYLMVKSQLALSKDAKARLAVIQKFTELGSGFQVATHDLEQRGAGELLGTRQKGHVHAVGLDLYAELLEDAVRELKGAGPAQRFDPELQFSEPSLIPESFIEDETLRLRLYKRLSQAKDDETVIDIEGELVERFGHLPPAFSNLIELMRIRCAATALGLSSVEQKSGALLMCFDPETPLSPSVIFELIESKSDLFSVPANYRLRYEFEDDEKGSPLTSARNCLQMILDRMKASQT